MLGGKMNKIKYFTKEISYIKDESKRRDIEYLINLLPDYFFLIPASSTGAYHPKFALTNSGLVKHTKVAVRIAIDLFDTVNDITTGANDANAEYVAELRKLFDDNKVRFQISELGKVDEGGGGTIAYILANKGMDVIDCGTPVLSMHSPYEVTSKFDVYMSYKAYKVFMK